VAFAAWLDFFLLPGRTRWVSKPMSRFMVGVLALALTIALGLLSRLYPIGWKPWDKSLGDVLYAVAAYLALALVSRKPVAFVAPVALAFCLAVEFFQATGIPARYAYLGIVRWLIGTDFSWHDVACYVIGVAFIAGPDLLLLRPPWDQRPPAAATSPLGSEH
jgi:hypothetical protein